MKDVRCSLSNSTLNWVQHMLDVGKIIPDDDDDDDELFLQSQ